LASAWSISAPNALIILATSAFQPAGLETVSSSARNQGCGRTPIRTHFAQVGLMRSAGHNCRAAPFNALLTILSGREKNSIPRANEIGIVRVLASASHSEFS
jgi:hypothetical protein